MAVPAFIQGCIAPTFTAFDDEGNLDPDGQRNLLDFMLRSRSISAFFLRSGMGQMYSFSFEDVKSLTRTACRHLAGKAPVLIGCSGAWDRDHTRRPDPQVYVDQCIALSHHAADEGADGLVFTMPEALTPRDGESTHDLALRFFEKMVAAVRLPVFIYQPPGTHEDYQLTPELIAALADMDGICAAKVSSGDLPYVLDLIRAVKDKPFRFITGNETIYYATLYTGSRAAIGQGCSLSPSVLDAVRRAYLADDRERALQAQQATNALVRDCRNAQCFLKRYATEHGFPVGTYARGAAGSPYGAGDEPLTDAEYNAVKQLLEESVARFPEPAEDTAAS